MKKFNYEDEFTKADKKWPSIKWNKNQYINHAETAGGHQTEHLYPAGAAGYRNKNAWQIIEEDFAPTVCQKMSYIAKADYSVEDLWSITRLHLMEEDKNKPKLDSDTYPARIIQYRGDTDLPSFMTIIAWQKARQRKRKIKDRNPISIDKLKDSEDGNFELKEKHSSDPFALIANEEVIMDFQKTLKETFDSLDTNHKYLLQMVLFQKMQKKEAGEKIGLDAFKTSRALKKIKESLSAKMQSYHDLWDNKQFRDAWTEICKRCLDQDDQDK